MSFAFMPLYTGDYLKDTRHLTPMRHGVYLLLLMHCWDSKGPAPLDEQECAGIANCRSADEIDALRYVLKRYFVRMNDGWYNKRMSDEVVHAGMISSNNRKAGMRSAEVRRARSEMRESTLVERAFSERSTLAGTPTITTTKPAFVVPAVDLGISLSVEPKNKAPSAPTRASAPVASPDLPDWIPTIPWEAWIDMRKRIRKPLTPGALKLAISKLERLRVLGHDPTAVLNQSTLGGWTGLYEEHAAPKRKPQTVEDVLKEIADRDEN